MVITPQQIKTLSAIHLLCIRINAETEYAAFYDLAGHCSSLTVSVRQSKENYQQFVYSTNKMQWADRGDNCPADEPEDYICFQTWNLPYIEAPLTRLLAKLTYILTTGKKARHNASQRAKYAIRKKISTQVLQTA